MKTIYESQVLRVDLESTNPIIIFTWLTASAAMSYEDYQEEMQQVAQLQITYKTHKPLVDIQDFQFVITPPIQEWVRSTHSSTVYQSGHS